MEVDRVLLEQVGPHDLPDIAEREKQFVVFVDGNQRRRRVAVQHTLIHDVRGFDARPTRIGSRREDVRNLCTLVSAQDSRCIGGAVPNPDRGAKPNR